jgi:hypothetical protein
MKNSNKIGEKKQEKKKRGMVLTVGDDVGGAVFRVQCIFPNIESEAVQMTNSNKIGKKSEW